MSTPGRKALPSCAVRFLPVCCWLVMFSLGRYLATLSTGRVILWCYAIWYVVNVAAYFDARPRLWLTSVGLSLIIGIALLISTQSSSKGTMELDRWQIFRLFLMPFCVSSFSALVKDAGYVLVFPPSAKLNAIGIGLIMLFVGLVALIKRSAGGVNKAGGMAARA